jgi:hypothetical protein
MTYNVSLVRISNSRGWGESYYELREIGRKKREKRNQEIKTPKEKRVDNIEMKLLSTWWLFYCLQIVCCTKHEIEQERNRNSFTPSCYTQATTRPLTPNLILDEERTNQCGWLWYMNQRKCVLVHTNTHTHNIYIYSFVKM